MAERAEERADDDSSTEEAAGVEGAFDDSETKGSGTAMAERAEERADADATTTAASG